MATVRSFVAVLLDHALRERLADAIRELRCHRADVKWVEPGNLHLTLKFLGPVAEERLPAVEQMVGQVAAAAGAFDLTCRGLGAFPNLRRPRVVWAGVQQGAKELTELAKGLDARLQELGFQREKRPFSAHVTLGRVKSPINLHRLTEAVEGQQEADFGPMRVTAVHLMKSTLTPSGPIYAVVQESALGERNASHSAA
ncbi:MAG: RNA 2',3'-cyclic phosphodiesterase [Armatimonadota bacterium]